MYYVNDVSLLEDEMTRYLIQHTTFKKSISIHILEKSRYHYFLQLKSDVMEGRLRCSYNEAVVLAGYRLQGIKLNT
jgi:tyrosine-protein phosphatase non-receptor type 14/21